MHAISRKKANLRKFLKIERAGLSPSSREAYNQRIFEAVTAMERFKNADTLFCYVSCGSEVDTHRLIDHALEMGKRLAVPRIMDGKSMVAVSMRGWDELVPGKLNILTPLSSELCTDTFDMCITPGLGFTRFGDRIGFGRGYYDKWFKQNPTYRAALAFTCQLLDEIPMEDTDIKVDAVVTETGIIECAGDSQ